MRGRRRGRFTPAIWIGLLESSDAGLIFLISQLAVPAETGQVALLKAPAGPRIWYPATRYPALTLPDGQRRTVRSVLNITGPMRIGNYVWNDGHIPPGPVWVPV